MKEGQREDSKVSSKTRPLTLAEAGRDRPVSIGDAARGETEMAKGTRKSH